MAARGSFAQIVAVRSRDRSDRLTTFSGSSLTKVAQAETNRTTRKWTARERIGAARLMDFSLYRAMPGGTAKKLGGRGEKWSRSAEDRSVTSAISRDGMPSGREGGKGDEGLTKASWM